jgi:hypothetical protein
MHFASGIGHIVFHVIGIRLKRPRRDGKMIRLLIDRCRLSRPAAKDGRFESDATLPIWRENRRVTAPE